MGFGGRSKVSNREHEHLSKVLTPTLNEPVTTVNLISHQPIIEFQPKFYCLFYSCVALLDSSVQPLSAGPGASTDGRRRQTPTGPSFEDAAKAFANEFDSITLGERNPRYVNSKSEHIRIHHVPFFGDTALADITAGKCRNIARTVRLRVLIQKPAILRNRLVRPCIARWSRSVRF